MIFNVRRCYLCPVNKSQCHPALSVIPTILDSGLQLLPDVLVVTVGPVAAFVPQLTPPASRPAVRDTREPSGERFSPHSTTARFANAHGGAFLSVPTNAIATSGRVTTSFPLLVVAPTTSPTSNQPATNVIQASAMAELRESATPNKTDAGNGSKAICRISNVARSPASDPRRHNKPCPSHFQAKE
jgi:hypothetical protein